MRQLLVTGSVAYTPDRLEALGRLGFEVHFMQQEAGPLPLPADEVEAVVCNGLFLHHPIAAFRRLRFIQLTSVGLDRVDQGHVRRHGILLHNARGVYSVPMAEWVLMRTLEHLKRADHFRQAQQQHEWAKHRGVRECTGRRVAVLGAGNIGQTVAHYLGAVGMEVTGYDLTARMQPDFVQVKAMDTLAADLPGYDVVVLTLPLTPQTHHLMDGNLLRRLGPDALLVNIARGPIVDEAALVDVLRERTDLRAALDVFEQEPLPADSPLWSLPGVSLSPHNSFIADGNQRRMFELTCRNLADFAKSQLTEKERFR